MVRSSRAVEYGDFQTPPDLARRCCLLLKQLGCQPRTVIEPTCGLGSFVQAAADVLRPEHVFGYDINEDYVAKTQILVRGSTVRQRDFFRANWHAELAQVKSPVLVVGNPPWVTNAVVGSLGGANLPAKGNDYGLSGMEALTGKSNFDVSEWMVLRLMEALAGSNAWLAFLCKTSVARKALQKRWRVQAQFAAMLFRINGKQEFNINADAGFLVVRFDRGSECCPVYRVMDPATAPESSFGIVDGHLVASVSDYKRWKYLAGDTATEPRWRSGVKHDCTNVMELSLSGGTMVNGFGEVVDIEPDFLYPMLKSSDVVKGEVRHPRRAVIVTQRSTGEDTRNIQFCAPRTWGYLLAHADALDARRSTIYQRRPRFSVFGVGPYTFEPWKVAVSGFYKSFAFACVGPHRQRPIVFDDTVYFLSLHDEAQARLLADLLNSDPAQAYLHSLVFWDAKRPVTAEVLAGLDLMRLAQCSGVLDRAVELFPQWRHAAQRASGSSHGV